MARAGLLADCLEQIPCMGPAVDDAEHLLRSSKGLRNLCVAHRVYQTPQPRTRFSTW